MKPATFPLRITSGFVVYMALWCAITPIVMAIFDFARGFPIESVIAAFAALVAFVFLWFLIFRRFTAWCDAGVRT